MIYKNFSTERYEANWLFDDLQATFDTVVKKALLWKLGEKRESTKFTAGIKEMWILK
jgi:hypothetical protein